MNLKDLDWKAKSKETYFNKDTQKECKRIEYIVDTSVLEKMQQLGKRNIYDSFIGTRIEYLSKFDLVGVSRMNLKDLDWKAKSKET